MRPPLPLLLLLPLAACTAGPSPWIEGGPKLSQVMRHRTWEPRAGPAGYVLRASHRTLSIDCQGLPLAIDGKANHVTATGCVRVSVDGNGNRVMAELGEAATVLVNGRYNVVRWSAAPGVTVATRAIGRHNRIERL